MALTAEQKALLVQIVLKSPGVIEAATGALTADVESQIVDNIDVWEPVKDSHTTLAGEVNFSNEPKRQAVRQRVLALLNLLSPPPFFSVASGRRGK